MATKKTALLLDPDLIAQAKEILGTKTTTETITEALHEVLRVQSRLRHLEWLRERAPDMLEIERIEKRAQREIREYFGEDVHDDGDPPR
jgi:hypothetical protein